ncbi:hypothetical protein [Staphylococcus phage vB_StaM_PB50]|nr:hypothetical protein [Staphylococcus phage vB_StaM_PB50]
MIDFKLYKNIDNGKYIEAKDGIEKYIRSFSFINYVDDNLYLVKHEKYTKDDYILRHQGMTGSFIVINHNNIMYRIKHIELTIRLKLNHEAIINIKLTPTAATLNKFESVGNFTKVRNLFYNRKLFKYENYPKFEYDYKEEDQIFFSEMFEAVLKEIENDDIDFYVINEEIIEEFEENKNKIKLENFSKYKDGTLEDYNILNFSKKFIEIKDEKEIKNYLVNKNFR